MAKPSSVVSWASDSTFASGPETGSPTKVDPGSGYKNQGLVPGLTFVGPYFNWLVNLIGQWIAYLNLSGTDELTYASTRSRTLPCRDVQAQTGGTSRQTKGGYSGWVDLNTGEAGLILEVPVIVPEGALITECQVRAEFLVNGVGGGPDGFVTLLKRAVNYAAASGTLTGLSETTVATAAIADGDGVAALSPSVTNPGGGVTVALSGLSETAAAGTTYFIRFGRNGVSGTGSSSVYAYLHGAEVTFGEVRATGHY